MNIKPLIAAAIAAACPLTTPAPAAQVAANGTEARKLVRDDGYIIFAYPDGWDDYSQKRCERLMADRSIRRAAGDAILMAYPIPESPDETRNRQLAEIRGELKIPGAWSYPALIFIDSAGWHYATLTGREVVRGSTEELAALIRDRMEKGKQRRRTEAEAFRSSDPAQRARLRYDAHNIDGLSGMDKGTRDAIRADDPQDSTGVIRSMDFNAYSFACNIGKDGIGAGMAKVDKMLADPAYTPRQKQQMCAAAIGMLRRNGGPAHAAAMRRYAERMQRLVPDSPEGRAAARILRDWIPELRYDKGWHPGCIPASPTPIEVVGELPIDSAGNYIVRLDYSSGQHSIGIHAVELYDGKEKIAEDRHWGVAGHKGENNIYRLSVPHRPKDTHLYITIGQSSRDSRGTITIEKQ